MKQDILSEMFSDFFKCEISKNPDFDEFEKNNCKKSFHAGVDITLKVCGKLIKAISLDLATGEHKKKLEEIEKKHFDEKIISGFKQLFPDQKTPDVFLDALKDSDEKKRAIETIRNIDALASKELFTDMSKASKIYSEKHLDKPESRHDKHEQKKQKDINEIKCRVDEFLKKEFGDGFEVNIEKVH